MNWAIQKSPLLPFLTVTALTVSTFAMNSHTLSWGQLPVPLLVCFAFSLVFWVQYFAVPFTRKSAGFLASLWAGVMLVWNLFPELPPKFTPVMLAGIIPALLIGIGTFLTAIYYKQINKALPAVSVVLSISIVVSLGISALQIGLRPTQTAQATPVIAQTDLPDIYFIVPDRFASPQALEESGLDCSDFVLALEARGFYVRPDAMSDSEQTPEDTQSSRTLHYMASVLNFGVDIDDSYSYRKLSSMVRSSQVGIVVKDLGYTYHHIGSWYPETALDPNADYNYIYEGNTPMSYLYSDLFSTAIIDRSILRRLTLAGKSITERDRHLFQLQTIKDIAASQDPSPKFVFAHLTLPHEPFVWAANGSIPVTDDKTQMQLYLDQVVFTEGYLLDMIDNIILYNLYSSSNKYNNNRRSNSIVIIQSDEGIIFPQSKEETEALSPTQYNGVLTAWKIPDTEGLDNINTRGILKYIIEEVQR